VTWLDEIELKGRKAGRAEALLEQLEARFGTVPAKARARIQAAEAPELARWSLRVLTATSLSEVFATARKAGPTRRPAARKAARQG
jgi:hypothetical protein